MKIFISLLTLIVVLISDHMHLSVMLSNMLIMKIRTNQKEVKLKKAM